MAHLAFLVIFYVSAGTFLCMGFLRQNRISRRYFLYHGLAISLVVATAYYFLALPFLDAEAQVWMSIFISSTALYSAAAGHWRWVARFLYPIALLAAFAVIVRDIELTFHYRMLGNAPLAYLVANALLSTSLLGCTLAALLLGHWYLFQPKLAVSEFVRLLFIFSTLICLRFGFGAYCLYLALNGKSEIEVFRYLFSTTPGIFVLLRWAWGLIGPALLAVLIWSSMRLRAVQSATGILYLAAVCILAGEIISQYLAFFHAIPL